MKVLSTVMQAKEALMQDVLATGAFDTDRRKLADSYRRGIS